MTDAQELLDRARALRDRDRGSGGAPRTLLGIAGPPGAGKTTLARALVAALEAEAPGTVAHVPMDGFHLADAQLRRQGSLERKGAPETFDAAGYRALLRRLRESSGEVVLAPAFDRELEQPVAGSIPVGPEVRLVISEGNYLLLESAGWQGTRALLDEVWWVDLPDPERTRRLRARHERYGKPPETAAVFVREVDGANAELVAPGRERADLVVPGEGLSLR